MRNKWFIILALFCIGLFLLPLKSDADDWNRLTTAVFDNPVQIPGQVLPMGIYSFKLAEVTGDRNVIQVWNADQSELIATVLGFPEFMSTTPTEDIFTFEKSENGSPMTLVSWFHRGNPNGERFIYPKVPKEPKDKR